MTIHLRAIFDNTGSTRCLRRIRQYKNEEAKRVAMRKLIEELSAMQTSKLPPWWVNI